MTAAAGADQARLMRPDGQQIVDPGQADLDAAAAGDAPFWLDLPGVTPEQSDWLEHGLGLHPLVIDDALKFGERPKVEDFDDYIAVVLYGAGPAGLDQLKPAGAPVGAPSFGSAPVDVTPLDALSEVHCIVSARYIITVHRGRCPAIEDAARRATARSAPASRPAALFYQVADALGDTFFPILSELDDRLDSIQGEIIRSPGSHQLSELAGYRGTLITLRKVIDPQTDIFATLSSGRIRVPGTGDEELPYLRDIHDHLKKLSDLTESFRELIAGIADVYMAQASNQLNVVMKQLAIISTVFLPLSFLTGFFGQNFAALTGHIGSWQAFVFLGIGTEALAVALLYRLFRRRGWLKT